jgi:Flp pilus assembly protein TadG
VPGRATLRRMLGLRRASEADERGVALVEFALVLPLVLLLLFAMIDFGKAFNYWNDETHLANEAARYAVVNNNPLGGSSLEAAIKQDADSAELRNGCSSCSIKSPGVDVKFCFLNKDPSTGAPITTRGAPLRAIVSASYHWMAYLGLPVSSGLTGSATMRIETDYKASSSNPSDYSGNAYLKGGPVPC